MATTFALVLMWAFLCSAGVLGQKYDWRNAPYGNDDFNVRASYAEYAQLACTDDRVANISFTVDKWITPEMEILRPNESVSFKTLDGFAGWHVSEDGTLLNISVIQDRHFGLYYCLVTDTTDGMEYAIKTGLNFKGAYWEGMWWRYEQAAIASIAGSLGYGLLCIIATLIWRRVGKKTDAAYSTAGEADDDFDTILAKLGYDNTGYTADEDPVPSYAATLQEPNHTTSGNDFGASELELTTL